jgi:hypothetical protein
MLALLLGAWALVTAGAAWVSSFGPALWVSDELESDLDYGVFRLRVGVNGSGTLRVAAFVEKIVNRGNELVVPKALLPIELIWTHHDAGVRPELSQHIEATVGVAIVEEGDVGWFGEKRVSSLNLRLHSVGHSPSITTREQFGEAREVAIKVRITVPGTSQSATRWFGFSPETSSRIKHKVKPLTADSEDRALWS